MAQTECAIDFNHEKMFISKNGFSQLISMQVFASIKELRACYNIIIYFLSRLNTWQLIITPFSQSLSVSQPGAMEPWHKISLLLCTVGFFKGMVPSDHYIFQYLTEFRHVPGEMVTNSYYPQYSYWAAGFLLIFLLTTDVLRYKPVIIISALAGVAHYITLRWTESVESLIVSLDGELIV